MNNNLRENCINTLRQIITEYNNNNRIYHSNMLEYHRNVNFMTNVIHNLSQTNRIPNYYTYESPRRMDRSQNDAYNDLLSIYFTNQLQRNTNTREGQGLSQQEITTHTEMVVYDSSMNEQICPITHIEFEEGEEVCKISSCGHYFKRHAIYRWFSSNTICPVCRHNLRSTQQLSSRENTDASSTNITNILANAFTAAFNDNLFDSSLNSISYTFDVPLNN